jgi:hypothetical protein
MSDNQDDSVPPLEAAEHYRRQIQSSEGHKSAIKWPTREQMIAAIKSRRHARRMMQFGLSANRIRDIGEQELARLRDPSTSGEFDLPTTHFLIGRMIGEIEKACISEGIPIGDGVVYGTSPRVGVEAGSRHVLGTDASIITINGPLISFCSVASKLLAITMVSVPLSMPNGTQAIEVTFTEQAIRQHLARRTNLIKYWMLFIDSYARTGNHTNFLPLQNFRGHLGPQRYALLRAMEIFAVAHEYGHHISHRGTTSSETTSFVENELEADIFAAKISVAIANRNDPIVVADIYTYSGAGGVLMLGMLDLVNRAKVTLESGSDQIPESLTHPRLHRRLNEIDTISELHGQMYPDSCTQTRHDLRDMIEVIWQFLKPIFEGLHHKGIRPEPTPSSGGWLPLFRMYSKKVC